MWSDMMFRGTRMSSTNLLTSSRASRGPTSVKSPLRLVCQRGVYFLDIKCAGPNDVRSHGIDDGCGVAGVLLCQFHAADPNEQVHTDRETGLLEHPACTCGLLCGHSLLHPAQHLIISALQTQVDRRQPLAPQLLQFCCGLPQYVRGSAVAPHMLHFQEGTADLSQDSTQILAR